MQRVILFFCFFCYIYKPEFIFIPHSVNLFMGLAGYLASTIPAVRNMIRSKSEARWQEFAKILVPICVVTVLTAIINISPDLYYIRYSISVIVAFYGAYLLAYLFYKTYGTLSTKILITYFVFATLLHLLLAIAMFFDQGMYQFLNSIVRHDASAVDAITRTEGFRLQGFGASFFMAGLIYGFVLIMMALGIKQSLYNDKQQILMLIAYLFISMSGLMMARTTIVGAGIGIFIILTYYKNTIRIFFKNILGVIIILAATLFLLLKLYPNIAEEFEVLFDFAFELVNNHEATGEWKSGTTDNLLDMYETIPDNIKTWLIGDARWMSADGRHYYMQVDVGYLRNIWYFGVVGLVIFLIYNLRALKLVFKKNRVFDNSVSRYAIITLFAYTLIINSKGPIDLALLIMPFYFVNVTDSIISKDTI